MEPSEETKVLLLQECHALPLKLAIAIVYFGQALHSH